MFSYVSTCFYMFLSIGFPSCVWFDNDSSGLETVGVRGYDYKSMTLSTKAVCCNTLLGAGYFFRHDMALCRSNPLLHPIPASTLAHHINSTVDRRHIKMDNQLTIPTSIWPA